MSFIHQFLDITDSLPRKIVRLLKLLKETENLSSELKTNLQKKREQYLHNLRDKTSKKNVTLKTLKMLQKELLSLSDYKLELIKEIKYMIDTSFLSNLSPIIKEGQKEVQDQLLSNNMNKINIPISYTNTNKIILDDDKKISEIKTVDTELTTGTSFNKLLSKKKSRPRNNKKTKDDLSLDNSNKILEDIKLDVYCKCKRESYGKMIQCDNPNCAEWFHYECIGIKEGNEPEEWYCCQKCKENAKKMKHKIQRIYLPNFYLYRE